MERPAVLVVDDEEPVRSALAELLSGAGYQVRTADEGEKALAMLAGGSFDVVLLDVVMPQRSGLEVLEQYRGAGGTVPLIVLSGLSSAHDAMRAMKLGATDYLSKPIDGAELLDTLDRTLRGGSRIERSDAPTQRAESDAKPGTDRDREARALISVSGAMQRARMMVDRIADADVPVLLLGESGTGKEVIARAVHSQSRRRGQPFIKVNCAALPAELLESELFGHEKGAFTGATAEKPGKFELAHHGTIFLDEIGEMAFQLQAKLLQVLQDEEFFRVGGKKSVRVDSRVVVATNRDLEREIELGHFREDLYYRLNVVSIRLPSLRERKDDIPVLVEHFLRRHGRRQGGATPELPAEVMRAFMRHEWPGNVRELENMVRRIVVLNDPNVVLEELRGKAALLSAPLVEPLPSLAVESTNRPSGGWNNPFTQPQPPPPPPDKPESEMSLKDIGKRAAMLAERDAILAMLQRTAWNKRRTANKLRISYKALLYKIRDSGIIDPRANAEL